MVGVQSVLAFAMVATGALAAPTKRSLSQHFSVSRPTKQEHLRNPTKAMVRAYRKYGWSMPASDDPFADLISSLLDGPATPSSSAAAVLSSEVPTYSSEVLSYSSSAVASATSSAAAYSSAVKYSVASTTVSSAASTTGSGSSSAASGEVTASPADEGAEYLSPVSIGGQTLNLDFDTGSADLWVFSTELPSSEIGEHSAYNSSASSTYESLEGASFDILYGDGSGAEGNVGYDRVNIGGAIVEKQAIEMAEKVSDAFVEDVDSDGLVGLGFSVLNSVTPTAQKTWFENIMSSLDEPLFTADLDSDGSGTYQFGVIDSTKYTGDLTYTSIDASSGYWQFNSTTYKVGDQTYTNDNGSPAIADTGTSLLLLDSSVVKAYYDQVSGSSYDSSVGGYTYPCDADLPDFAVAVGSEYMATLSGSKVTFAEVDSETCYGGIQSNSDSGLQIFGDVLLQQHFVVFHGGNKELGMASKA